MSYDAPNKDINKFFGTFKLRRDPKIEFLTIDNLILRGQVIKNTGW